MIAAILTLAGKDLALLWRDKAALFWVFLFPMAVAVLFGVMFGGGQRGVAVLPVMALDQDDTEGSRAFLKSLEESPVLKVERAADLAAGELAVRRGQAVAFLVARAGLARALAADGQGAAALELRADPSRRAELSILRGLIAEAATAGVAAPKLEVVSVAGDGKRPHTPFELSFPAAMAWGLIGCAATFALSIVRERQAGTFLRLRAAPLSRGDILAGKALACWLACMAELVLLLAVGMIFFNMRPAEPRALLMAFAAASVGFVGLMMLLSQVGRGEVAVASAGWAVMLVLAMFGGAMMPYFLMPEWMQDVGRLSPVRWAIVALEGALWRGLSWRELLRPCLTLVAVGGVAFAAGVLLLRRRAG